MKCKEGAGMKKRALSQAQLAALVWAGVLAPAAELLPGAALSAGRGAWLAPLAALPLALLSVWLLTRLARDRGLARGILDGLGPWLGRGVLLFYMVWALGLLALRLRLCAGRMLSSGYRDGALPYFLLAAAGVVFWLAGGSLAAFARAGQLFLTVLAVTGGAILLLSLPQVRFVRLLPLWTGDVGPVLRGGLAAAGVLGWGSCWAFLAGETPSGSKGSCGRTALGCLVLTLAQGVILGSLGPVLAGRLDSPFLALAKSVGVEGAFQRVESVVAALWVTADVTMAGLLVFALRAMASAAVPRYQEEWVGRGAVVLAVLAALLLPGRQVETLERLALGANLWFGLLLPILLAVWIKLHKRG